LNWALSSRSLDKAIGQVWAMIPGSLRRSKMTALRRIPAIEARH
jgi:hypothetical protein